MLLFQWGGNPPINVEQPTDLRPFTDEDSIGLAITSYQTLDFTRQIMAAGEDPDAEFDDVAVQLSLSLLYDLANGDEPSSSLWIERPDEIDAGLAKFFADPFVASLLPLRAQRLIATVHFCG